MDYIYILFFEWKEFNNRRVKSMLRQSTAVDIFRKSFSLIPRFPRIAIEFLNAQASRSAYRPPLCRFSILSFNPLSIKNLSYPWPMYMQIIHSQNWIFACAPRKTCRKTKGILFQRIKPSLFSPFSIFSILQVKKPCNQIHNINTVPFANETKASSILITVKRIIHSGKSFLPSLFHHHPRLKLQLSLSLEKTFLKSRSYSTGIASTFSHVIQLSSNSYHHSTNSSPKINPLRIESLLERRQFSKSTLPLFPPRPRLL